LTQFEPLRVTSLKDACVSRLEGLILSGELVIGARLPAERDLAAQLGVSRPVLHEAIVDLAAKGLVEISPRRGVFISDYRTSGSCALLSSLLAYQEGEIDAQFTESLIEMRLLIESEAARLASLRRSPEHLVQLNRIVAQEKDTPIDDPALLTDLDFAFHQTVVIASGNRMYPLIINSFKGVYVHFTGQFFQQQVGRNAITEVHAFHAGLVQAITARDPQAAQTQMSTMLTHGAAYLRNLSA
jgi:DNA-binding FadR family transcriptional regulator